MSVVMYEGQNPLRCIDEVKKFYVFVYCKFIAMSRVSICIYTKFYTVSRKNFIITYDSNNVSIVIIYAEYV